jgi:glycosyltransferase involved in cell wall biosynthesis
VADAGRVPQLRGPGGRRLRVAHLTTVDMSLALLLPVELAVDLESGLDVVGVSAAGPYVERVEALGLRHVPVHALTRAWRPGQDLRAAVELARLLRTLRLDVLHTHNPKTGVLGRVLGRLIGVPVVVNTCHGLWVGESDGRLKRGLVLGAEAFASWFSDAELFQNDDDARALRRWTPRGRSTVVGNGTDLARFLPDPEQRAAVRRQLGVGDDELLVGGVGRLVAEKGIGEYAAAARALRGKARFVWAGPADSDKPDALTSVGDDVELLGEWRDMPAFYNALDVFCLPSYREGFSRSAMEAAACCTAMVLSDIRGCREIGADGDQLRLFPPRDATALTAALGELLADDQLRRSLAVAARARAQDAFDQRQVAGRSLETYASVARRKRLGWTSGNVAEVPGASSG